MAGDSEKLVPAYIPWETFTGFVAHLKATVVPTEMDKTAMPESMPALTRGQIQSALKFLGLVRADGTTTDELRALVKCHDTSSWQDGLKNIVVGAYGGIIGDLSLEHATQRQLDERFKAVGVSGQMLLKSVRFYLSALTAAGLPFSPHLNARRKRAVSSRKKAANPKIIAKPVAPPPDAAPTRIAKQEFTPAEGTRSYPLYFRGKPDGVLVVPAELSAADCKVIELQLAVLRAYAETVE